MSPKKKYREALKDKGKCVGHPSVDVVPGKTECQKCIDHNKARHEKNKAKGKCRSHPSVDVVPGKTTCQECIDHNKARKAHNKKNGMCVGHKNSPTVLGTNSCSVCYLNPGIYRAKKQGYAAPNITAEELNEADKHPRSCAVKGCTRTDLCLDHCHETGKVRGWLCDAHNKALGLCHDSLEELEGLIEYLKNPPGIYAKTS